MRECSEPGCTQHVEHLDGRELKVCFYHRKVLVGLLAVGCERVQLPDGRVAIQVLDGLAW